MTSNGTAIQAEPQTVTDQIITQLLAAHQYLTRAKQSMRKAMDLGTGDDRLCLVADVDTAWHEVNRAGYALWSSVDVLQLATNAQKGGDRDDNRTR